jgi:hypothetical protein
MAVFLVCYRHSEGLPGELLNKGIALSVQKLLVLLVVCSSRRSGHQEELSNVGIGH